MRQSIYAIVAICVFSAELYSQSAPSNSQAEKAKIELGRRLFYDADLSINGTMSCATCHEQRRAFSDGNSLHPGALDDPGKRNVPGLANVSLYKNLTWAHNHLSGLAEQSFAPIRGTDPIEMGMNAHEDEITKRLGQNSCYQKLFSLAFSEEKGAINLGAVSKALESFEKTLISNDSLYDQKMKSKQPLPTKDAQAGKKLFFGAAKCNSCHTAPLFSDDDFHQVQPQNQVAVNKIKDNGLSDVTGNPKDKNFFRTPSLRNAVLTAPYWHDGSAKTLTEAIQKHDVKINQALSEKEINKIIAFLQTLSDTSFITNPQYAKPSQECPY
ncbi:MAG: cytochrome c peroxidase [Sulfuricurvum sp.]|uniref:cytochrome-c peroxidase n=1 Tax=Sulfuricurvum sp. TaxID=2025608 RepID=UPI00262737B9|nr:cytochrome c peroxidase [Sulfuricurvum sp.]MDD2828693.1 cytochrome c peroxidase [Sulfuricurvum sp.]MDD4949271.1 cytochrome c peroxidase [Sulfuricurvum sp.]